MWAPSSDEDEEFEAERGGGRQAGRHPLSGKSPALRGARVKGTTVPQMFMSSQLRLQDCARCPDRQRE